MCHSKCFVFRYFVRHGHHFEKLRKSLFCSKRWRNRRQRYGDTFLLVSHVTVAVLYLLKLRRYCLHREGIESRTRGLTRLRRNSPDSRPTEPWRSEQVSTSWSEEASSSAQTCFNLFGARVRTARYKGTFESKGNQLFPVSCDLCCGNKSARRCENFIFHPSQARLERIERGKRKKWSRTISKVWRRHFANFYFQAYKLHHTMYVCFVCKF